MRLWNLKTWPRNPAKSASGRPGLVQPGMTCPAVENSSRGLAKLSQTACSFVVMPHLIWPTIRPRLVSPGQTGRFPMGFQGGRTDHHHAFFAVIGKQIHHDPGTESLFTLPISTAQRNTDQRP